MKQLKSDIPGDRVSVDATGKVINLTKQMNKDSFANKEIFITNLTDARIDSILNRPRNETYETDQGENVGATLRVSNYTHTAAEEKIDNTNRKNRANILK